ncbi:translation elongation factor Ts [Candidatus Enterovibrio altilux]|uniref:Elongation factor Ts n=1 Tax=Candidatus Enterovibrio altilux TaxID=1927128 RepID=A0A291BAH4_9GAMM|nr:translation elongation factor Ts [Candidatus Enterovibrio luxaltus]ATF09987.1 Translation elongation factor Ts [Candidatus Enterovibrio luxaltus]
MAIVTTALIKELRERTAAGIIKCKTALVESDGCIELAIENMRKSGAAKAAKKAGNIAAEGTITIKNVNDVAVLVEINCQTDFVAKDDSFTVFANSVADAALTSKSTIEELQAQFEEARIALVTKIGENISIRRVRYVQGVLTASYRHGERIGVIVAGAGDKTILQRIAMHIAASRPEYINPKDIPADIIAKEQQIQVEIAMNEGKPHGIAEKIVIGRMNKFISEVSLLSQPFIMEPKSSVGEFLKEKNTSVSNFARLEVGEGIEKAPKISYADEIAAVQKG